MFERELEELKTRKHFTLEQYLDCKCTFSLETLFPSMSSKDERLRAFENAVRSLMQMRSQTYGKHFLPVGVMELPKDSSGRFSFPADCMSLVEEVVFDLLPKASPTL